MLDPALVAAFTPVAATWLADLAEGDLHRDVLDAEPTPPVEVVDVRSVAEVFGDLADLKSPYLLGHARGVAALAADTRRVAALPDPVGATLDERVLPNGVIELILNHGPPHRADHQRTPAEQRHR